MMDHGCAFFILLTWFASFALPLTSVQAFTGAVYEHARQGNGSTSDIRTNLKQYERATILAKKQGADLILFPEYGLVPPAKREAIKENLEGIPDPRDGPVVVCDQAFVQKSPILYSLGCMAKKNGIVVVANMGGIEDCRGQPGCNDDGDRQLNANVAFDRRGALIGRYYKEHLYFEDYFDLPAGKQDPTFTTDVGKFAMFICFDIIFRKMADVSRLSDVDAVLFSAMWFNTSPFYTSTQLFSSWAMGNNATLMAANVQIPGHLNAGSGIFRGRQGALVSLLMPDGHSKLMVATVPNSRHNQDTPSKIIAVTDTDAELLLEESQNIPMNCSYKMLGEATDISKDYRCSQEDLSNYTMKKLDKLSDHLEVCHNGMCCELDYHATNMSENFYFGVFNGSVSPFGDFRYFWLEENCFLARCDDNNGTSCSSFSMKSKTLFHKLVLRANFASRHVYPALISSNMRLVPASEWTYRMKQNKPTIEFHGKGYGLPLLTATLKGRLYSKNPSFVQ